MSIIPGSLVTPGKSSSGGILPSNYFSAQNTSNVTPATGNGTTIGAWTLLDSEGTCGVGLNGGSTAFLCNTTGLYVIYFNSFGFSWTPQAGGGPNAASLRLFGTFADANALIDQGIFENSMAYDERGLIGGTGALPGVDAVTTPPLKLTANDTFTLHAILAAAATALTAPVFPALDVALAVVQVG